MDKYVYRTPTPGDRKNSRDPSHTQNTRNDIQQTTNSSRTTNRMNVRPANRFVDLEAENDGGHGENDNDEQDDDQTRLSDENFIDNTDYQDDRQTPPPNPYGMSSTKYCTDEFELPHDNNDGSTMDWLNADDYDDDDEQYEIDEQAQLEIDALTDQMNEIETSQTMDNKSAFGAPNNNNKTAASSVVKSTITTPTVITTASSTNNVVTTEHKQQFTSRHQRLIDESRQRVREMRQQENDHFTGQPNNERNRRSSMAVSSSLVNANKIDARKKKDMAEHNCFKPPEITNSDDDLDAPPSPSPSSSSPPPSQQQQQQRQMNVPADREMVDNDQLQSGYMYDNKYDSPWERAVADDGFHISKCFPDYRDNALCIQHLPVYHIEWLNTIDAEVFFDRCLEFIQIVKPWMTTKDIEIDLDAMMPISEYKMNLNTLHTEVITRLFPYDREECTINTIESIWKVYSLTVRHIIDELMARKWYSASRSKKLSGLTRDVQKTVSIINSMHEVAYNWCHVRFEQLFQSHYCGEIIYPDPELMINFKPLMRLMLLVETMFRKGVYARKGTTLFEPMFVGKLFVHAYRPAGKIATFIHKKLGDSLAYNHFDATDIDRCVKHFEDKNNAKIPTLVTTKQTDTFTNVIFISGQFFSYKNGVYDIYNNRLVAHENVRTVYDYSVVAVKYFDVELELEEYMQYFSDFEDTDENRGCHFLDMKFPSVYRGDGGGDSKYEYSDDVDVIGKYIMDIQWDPNLVSTREVQKWLWFCIGRILRPLHRDGIERQMILIGQAGSGKSTISHAISELFLDDDFEIITSQNQKEFATSNLRDKRYYIFDEVAKDDMGFPETDWLQLVSRKPIQERKKYVDAAKMIVNCHGIMVSNIWPPFKHHREAVARRIFPFFFAQKPPAQLSLNNEITFQIPYILIKANAAYKAGVRHLLDVRSKNQLATSGLRDIEETYDTMFSFVDITKIWPAYFTAQINSFLLDNIVICEWYFSDETLVFHPEHFCPLEVLKQKFSEWVDKKKSRAKIWNDKDFNQAMISKQCEYMIKANGTKTSASKPMHTITKTYNEEKLTDYFIKGVDIEGSAHLRVECGNRRMNNEEHNGEEDEEERLFNRRQNNSNNNNGKNDDDNNNFRAFAFTGKRNRGDYGDDD